MVEDERLGALSEQRIANERCYSYGTRLRNLDCNHASSTHVLSCMISSVQIRLNPSSSNCGEMSAFCSKIRFHWPSLMRVPSSVRDTDEPLTCSPSISLSLSCIIVRVISDMVHYRFLSVYPHINTGTISSKQAKQSAKVVQLEASDFREMLNRDPWVCFHDD